MRAFRTARKRLAQAGLWRGYSGGGPDVRKIIEGRFAKPELGIPAAAGFEAEAAEAAYTAAAPLHPFVEPPAWRRRVTTFFRVFLPVSGITCMWYGFTHPDDEPLIPRKLPPELQYLAAQQQENQNTFSNWSATHEARPKRVFQPETDAEVGGFLAAASRAGQKLRVMGSGLSPNGLSLSGEGVLSMALMDRVIKVDPGKKQVTVQAGARVQAVADALKQHGLTLQNYASIREQQIGGFTQVGAHGTGARIPPVDDQVVSLKLVTPGLGAITLSKDEEPELFSLAKVGLGALGVVTEMTLQCVPRHRLVEETFTTTLPDIKKHHTQWLKEYRHLRYMWLPYTDTVVVVRSNPEESTLGQAVLHKGSTPARSSGSTDEATRLQPLQELYASKAGLETASGPTTAAGLRDALLALDPLNKEWVERVNRAEAEVWKRSAGVRVGYSDEILGFDCGGQQWVMETAFPVGKLDSLKGVTRDIEYMESLMKEIRAHKVPAPAPIEQRWTSGSSSAMSPAAGSADEVFSWVGTIMYLPEEAAAREKVTDVFRSYCKIVEERLMGRYNAAVHWAKLEVPPGHEQGGQAGKDLVKLRARLAARYPVAQFTTYREVLDPKNVLANEWVDALMPRSDVGHSEQKQKGGQQQQQ